MANTLTHEELTDIIHYDPNTGVFTYRVSISNKRRKGNVVLGSINPDGYSNITILGDTNPAHRVAYLYMSGAWPIEEVDHINGDPSDNRWSNLRPITHSQNAINRKQHTNNTSGHSNIYIGYYKGIIFYRVEVKYAGVSHRSSFNSIEEAILHRDWLIAEHHGEYARTGKA